ncbi:hypothetical protein [Paenibacillus sp. TH7-28]
MKKKTREIRVCEKEYIYVINQKYSQQKSMISKFCTWDNPIAGSPLLTGVALKNRERNHTENVNLHRPKWISELTQYALDHGWTGGNCMEFPDGLDILDQMGYDVDWLRNEVKSYT